MTDAQGINSVRLLISYNKKSVSDRVQPASLFRILSFLGEKSKKLEAKEKKN